MKEIPEFLEQMLEKQYGQEITEKIKQGYSIKRPVTIRVNTIKSNKNKIEAELEKEDIKYKEINEQALKIENVKEDIIKNMQIYKNGEIYLQSISSMLPPIVVNPKAGENILDMAAAPGGKTTQMAAISNNEAMITACEKNKIRAERLKYNLEKQGANRVNIMQEDARKLNDFFSFDKILLDAPCSGSGTDNIFQDQFTEELIQRLAKTQEELLKKAIKIVKKGGEIIYSTCSILSQENEEIIKKVLPFVQVEPITALHEIPTLPTSIKGTICICPNELYEGFYIAKLIKK